MAEMSTKNSQDSLAERVTNKDLTIIAKSVGKNWERLLPHLLKTNSDRKLVHIKAYNLTTIMCIYQMFLAWSKEVCSDDATLGHLFHTMLQNETSVEIEWESIAKQLDLDLTEIRASCLTGYKRPVQETNINQPIETVQTDVKNDNDRASLKSKRSMNSYRPPKKTCIYDGRFINLEIKDIEDLAKTCKQLIGKGALGEVYRSKDVSDGFGMKIALKKIKLDGDEPHSIGSIKREMNSSRILHPFILPLLAVVDHRPASPEFWTVSPFFENGNLHNAIAGKSVQLKEKDRVKILLQLASAIQYIHTKVPNVRNVILHKDISSYNVVLDLANNARLIDFGLARELDDQTSHTKGRYLYSPPTYGHGVDATECWDYYSYGVIVREMLTGLGPEGLDGKFLKNMKPDGVCRIFKKNELWPQLGNASVLNDIADQCLHCDEWGADQSSSSNRWTVDEFETNVVEKIKEIWVPFGQSKIFDVQDSQCHICMINRKAEETSMTQKHAANCQQKIEVCIACEKNSFLNPITCYCGTKLSPLGSRWGALLIAGNDGNKEMAEALATDVKELKNLLTSKAPCIVGISENNIRMVTPCSHENTNSKELMLPEIRKHVKYFQEQTELDTLLIYFSGHCAWNNERSDVGPSSFMLEPVSEIVTLTDFQEMLDDLDKVDKLIVILDRCFPPKIKFKNENRKVIQINACGQTETAHMTENGSIFTKTLIQGLKGKAERLGCSEDCQFCKDYFDGSSDFITVLSISKYLENHINSPKPRMIVDGFKSNIAFFTDEQVKIAFTEKENQTRHKVVELEYLKDMEQLQKKLYEAFKKDESRYRVKVQRNTYRKDNQFEDCDTIEKVALAWVHRQPLEVEFDIKKDP